MPTTAFQTSSFLRALNPFCRVVSNLYDLIEAVYDLRVAGHSTDGSRQDPVVLSTVALLPGLLLDGAAEIEACLRAYSSDPDACLPPTTCV